MFFQIAVRFGSSYIVFSSFNGIFQFIFRAEIDNPNWFFDAVFLF